MRREVGLGVVAAVGVIVAVAALASAGCGSESPEPAPPATVMVEPGVDQGTPEATPFILTAEQRQRVVEIALNDSRVGQLVQDERLTVSDVIPWSDGTGEFIGGGAILALEEPHTIDGVWLGVVFGADEITYDSMPYRARLSNVSSLMVWVDLHRAEVVGLEPDHDARPEGTPEILATPNVTPQAGD